MDNKNILSKIKKRRIYLNNLSAIKIDGKPDGTTINVKQSLEYDILKNTKEDIVLKINIKTRIEPEALFSIEAEYIMEFITNEVISNEEIDNNIAKIVAPLGADVSYMIASLTKEMIGSHMILPPVLELGMADKK